MARRRRARSSRRSSGMNFAPGMTTFKLSEPLDADLTSAHDVIKLNPSKLGITRLNNTAKQFGRYRWTELTVQYVPAVGTSKDGSFIMAYTTLSEIDAGKLKTVVGSPKIYTSVSQSKTLSIPARLIMPSSWLDKDSQCGGIHWATSAASKADNSTTCGNLLFRGTIQFEGPLNV